ncbi:hypothetical protein BBJ28_00018555 [Nothophytophthora sp. Chile5]|nr:hypothetical protein BBJ28_00018555 [Nothophytophthora sp. Chile5]
MALTRSSIDMSMVGAGSSFTNGTKLLLEQSPEYVDRLKESAHRVVKLKLMLGLYDNPMPGEENLALIGNDDDVAAALQLARESIVLLQNNDSVLPLSPSSSVFLTGHSADSIGNQCGGWSLLGAGLWGHDDLFTHGISVKTGLEAIAGNETVAYFNGLSANGSYSSEDLATAKQLASESEYTIAVIGESTYVEKDGDSTDLDLPEGQIEYVTELASTGTKVIVILFEGRPRLLGDLPSNVHAVINGLLAGEQAGKAVAEIIYGQTNPSGRMPITYPKDPADVMIPYNHRVTTQCASGDYCEMQWDFGTGLSYTSFEYSALTLSTTNVTSSSDSIEASVVVTNTGSMAGKETVMLFITQPYRSLSVPEVKQLKQFSKVSLEPGEVTTVAFTLTAADWSMYYPQIGLGLKQVAEDSDFVVAIKPETDCDVYNETAVANPLCATFTLQTGDYPFGTLISE